MYKHTTNFKHSSLSIYSAEQKGEDIVSLKFTNERTNSTSGQNVGSLEETFSSKYSLISKCVALPWQAAPSLLVPRDNRYIKRPSARTPFTHPWQHVPAVIRTTKHLWELGFRLFPMACPRLSHRVTGNRHPNIVSVAQKGFGEAGLDYILYSVKEKRFSLFQVMTGYSASCTYFVQNRDEEKQSIPRDIL